MSDDGIDKVFTALMELKADREILQEDLEQVRNMFALEDRGWALLSGTGYDRVKGLGLDQVKDLSRTIREYRVGSPLIKRAIALRTTYVFSKGMNIPGYETDLGVRKKRGRTSRREKFYGSAVNRATLLEAEGHERLESSASTEGNTILIGVDSTAEVRQIPFDEVVGVVTNPDFRDEIWAILREWTSVDANGKDVPRKKWIYTDEYPGERQQSINDVGVDTGQTAFVQRFNTQAGWLWGVPDAVAAVQWSKIYTELVMSGKAMTEALAKFALKATGFKGRKVPDIGAMMGNGSGKGVALGEGQDLVPLSSAGRAYDFDGVRPVAALVATAMEVSIVHLLSDPGAAGSSYGSASNLDLPTKRAMVFRQKQWADFYARVIRWGTNEDVVVTFPPLEDPDLYREMQTAVLAWNTGTVHPDEIRPRAMEIAGITSQHDSPPEGVMFPNNDQYDEPSGEGNSVAPGQGQSDGTGGVGDDNALKSTI